ncbi:hypothetical protein [Melittangium boletus]|uniref:Uncharacterized protein n=1 Tax=Melittangium boletus DSM 14713 TaxID=1294270 RepID=A0A250INT2_9BACT|nr:hypothetical protein [Melittangium boletus]ATB33409.1 hypothetical protein MEBOL_006904 [Melittangium boletus DSM 14713]
MYVHVLLCLLLAIQQPSVVVRSAAWQQCRSVTSTQSNGLGSMVEEEKLPGLGSSSRLRMSAMRGWSGGHGSSPTSRRVLVSAPAPDLSGQDIARSHWRKVLLPVRSPLDDDPLKPV